MSKQKIRPNIKKIGETGEDLAAHYLISQGYEILFRNFHSAYGEIDIIAMLNEEVVFFEVKTRSSKVENALRSVSRKKCRKLRQTAASFLSRFQEYEDNLTRFDIIVIIIGKKGQLYTIQHFDNAFADI